MPEISSAIATTPAQTMRSRGFRYVRIPVKFLYYLDIGTDGYTLDKAMLARLDGILDNIIGRGMVAILDFHYLVPEDVYSFSSADEKRKNEDQFLSAWRIVADSCWGSRRISPH